jgi:hypothetical protein
MKKILILSYPDNSRWQETSNIHKLKIHFSDEIVAMTAGTLVLAKNKHKDEAFLRILALSLAFILLFG